MLCRPTPVRCSSTRASLTADSPSSYGPEIASQCRQRKEMPMQHKPIHQQVIAVVGAASGIGRETALLAASRGAAVAAFDNDEAGLQTLVNDIERYGGTVRAVSGDVAD